MWSFGLKELREELVRGALASGLERWNPVLYMGRHTGASLDKLEAEVTGPGGPVGNMEFDPRDGKGSFTPREYGNLGPPALPANQPACCMIRVETVEIICRYARGPGDERGRGCSRVSQLCAVDAKLKEGLRRHRTLRCGLHS